MGSKTGPVTVAIVAKLTFTQDFFASSGGRVPHYIAKTAMKIFLGLSIAFLIFSLLPSESDSQGTGPKVTHTVTFPLRSEDKALEMSKSDSSARLFPRKSS